jgi:regulator of protease activity HflC (stomatin/prohibitin superfamily)
MYVQLYGPLDDYETTLRTALGKHTLDEMLSEKLAQAAGILARQPQAIQLRYLETLTVIAADKNSTIVFPLPMDIVTPLIDALKRGAPPAV